MKDYYSHYMLKWILCDEQLCEKHNLQKKTISQIILKKKQLKIKTLIKKLKNKQIY